jgi:hypothetical protein
MEHAYLVIDDLFKDKIDAVFFQNNSSIWNDIWWYTT